ncbi:MAG: hypothetical protein H6609_09425 [Ignavibacteriales bacterium]|nr:hypothetical protein [Ignavibacteriales bacterium]
MKSLLSFLFLIGFSNLIISSESSDTIILKRGISLSLNISEVHNLGIKFSDGQFCYYRFISIIQTNNSTIVNKVKQELPQIEIRKDLRGVFTLDFNKIIFKTKKLNSIKHLSNQNSKKNVTVEYYACIESSLLFNTKSYFNVIKEEKVSDIYPVSFYISAQGIIKNIVVLELKPGIVFGGEYYTGVELGFYLGIYFNEQKYYLGLGYNMHDNFENGPSKSTSKWGTSESIDYMAIKIAYKPKYYWKITLGYYNPIDNFSYYSRPDVFTVSNKITFNHLLKLGFELSI